MKILIGLALTAALGAAALAAENPDWAYPVTPPPGQLDTVTMKSVPGSSQQYTQAQIDDPFNPPDWFPTEHPAMPQIVAHGGPKPAGRACAQCHLPSGDGHPESASLAGLPANYIIRQMATFKRGERNNPRAGVMIAMAQVLSDDEIKAAAAYFAGLKPTAGYNTVKETDTVTKSHVGAGGMRFATEGGETEPIGDRIIVLPKDETEAKLRDPHSGFIDNVPSGSIARGQALAMTGDNGKTIPCTLCHGPDLKGSGEVPSIVGRPATYVYRQLNDIKNDARRGVAVQFMKPVVANLTDSDMIALAAFLESRNP
ncbi:MAG TPA: c-type cytochrome [Xanthobacteraceae bacterium]|nr:c-type cytochrome [Xanthobacteraceae bacterium]